ncbi:unnamed protein product [Mytilus coruscus]|uniref:Uncharacterized protein n=1 Tax=Mytilus coruscus TaxID=42192 RepID=A0A6J8E0X5_MYTCO|nr:unnamed protein product [Mytilus coruscus]
MASLSVVEENYVRMSLLLTGISPRAARTFYDSEFAPACLNATIKKEYNKLLDLKKKHRINLSQWNLLCPRFPDVPDSKFFDLTLMILLLRNLTPITLPLCGFDCQPFAMEITPAADLARIKHYRNYLAHFDDGKLDTGFFNTAWNDIANAIDRLGGQQIKQECDHLRTKPLDQTNKEIMINIKHSNNEIRELKESFESLIKSHELLQEHHAEVKKSHEILQDDHRKVTQEMETIKTSQKDTVPWNIRARINDTLKDWKDNDDTMFINTRAAQYVLECIKENSCVTITASSGVGMTATLRHVALQMAEEEEYDVLMVTEPGDILRFFQNPFSIYEAEIDKFLKKGHHAKNCALALCVIFNKQIKEEMLTEQVNEETRAIIENTCEACKLDRGTSRLVLQDELDSLTNTFIKKRTKHIYGQEIVNCLIRNADSGLIKERFLLERKDDMDQFITIIPQKYHQLFIERMIDDWSKGKVQDVFSNINMKISQFRQKFLCYLKTLDISYQRRLANICDEGKPCKQTFLMYKDDNTYDTCLLHCCYIGDTSLVKWCCGHGVNVNRCTYNGQSPVTKACEHGHIEIVKMLLDRGADYNKCDRTGQSPVMKACKHGHIEILKILLDRGANYHKCDWDSQSPMIKACEYGHTEIVKMLLDRGADCNKCNRYGLSPLKIACGHGHTEIVKMLIDRGADCNKCYSWGQSPVMKACGYDHTEKVKMLLDRGADSYECYSWDQSPLVKACEHGHTEIVNMLLDRGANCNAWDYNGKSPVMKSCEHGHTEIVKMLLDRGADYNKCHKRGQSPIMMACEHGHTEIVKMLLDRGADCNACDYDDQSLVEKACEHSHTEIVKMLLDRGAD